MFEHSIPKEKYVFKAPTFQFDYFMVVLCFVSENYTLLLPAFFFDFIFVSHDSFSFFSLSCVKIFHCFFIERTKREVRLNETEHASNEKARCRKTLTRTWWPELKKETNICRSSQVDVRVKKTTRVQPPFLRKRVEDKYFTGL